MRVCVCSLFFRFKVPGGGVGCRAHGKVGVGLHQVHAVPVARIDWLVGRKGVLCCQLASATMAIIA